MTWTGHLEWQQPDELENHRIEKVIPVVSNDSSRTEARVVVFIQAKLNQFPGPKSLWKQEFRALQDGTVEATGIAVKVTDMLSNEVVDGVEQTASGRFAVRTVVDNSGSGA